MAYSYDTESRVTGLTYSSGSTQLGTLTYSYDAAGGVTGKTGSLAQSNTPTPVSGNAFNADNEMSGFNGATLTYDNNGNLTADGTNAYSWDARKHLTGISGAATASFAYDAAGRRVRKTVNGTTTQSLYDRLNPVQELDGTNTPTAAMLTGLGIDEYLARTDPGNGTQSFLGDMLGSTLALTNSSGAITTSYGYQPFGATTVGGSASGNSYEFTGRENDGTGLYFYRARYYSAMLQRFIAQDPIGFRGGFNLYGYVSNTPLNLVDPLGTQQQQVVPPSLAPSPTPSPILPGNGNTRETPTNGPFDCCCWPGCGIPPGTPDWAAPRMQELLEQGMTWWEAEQELQKEIDNGTLEDPFSNKDGSPSSTPTACR